MTLAVGPFAIGNYKSSHAIDDYSQIHGGPGHAERQRHGALDLRSGVEAHPRALSASAP